MHRPQRKLASQLSVMPSSPQISYNANLRNYRDNSEIRHQSNGAEVDKYSGWTDLPPQNKGYVCTLRARQHDFDLAASISHLPAVPISGCSLDKSSHAVGGWLKRGIRKAYRVSMMLVRGNSARTWSLGPLTVPSDDHDGPSRLASGTSKHFSDNFNKHGITDSAA